MKRLTWMHTFSRLLKAQEGSAIPMIGLASFVLIGSAGIAIDMGRVQVVQSRMSNALDAAGLAAGSTINTADINTEVSKYFYANFPTNYMGTTVDVLTVAASANNGMLTLDSHGHVPTTFMRIFGKTSVEVSAHSEITRASKGMELVLVMDTTGSMDQSAGGGQTKIQAAKAAANSLVNILWGDDEVADQLWVGLVPFAQAVNIGSTRDTWVNAGTFNWGPTSWAGCVDAREGTNRDVTDDPPSVARFDKYYWPDDSNNNWISTGSSTSTSYVCYHLSTCRCTNYPCGTTTNNGVTTTIACSGSGSNRVCTSTVTTPTTTYTIDGTHGPNKYCSQTVTPMTATKSTLTTDINSMTTDGNTHIVMGAVWGYRMLSPRWQGLWGGEMNDEGLPLDYDTPLMMKVMILMTDGDNTIDNGSRGAYWYLNNGHLGTTNSTTAVTQLNSRLVTVCNSMKSHGVIVYTIAFGTGISTSAQNMLRSCATKPEYYFFSPSGSSLQNAFYTIGDSLANLRISK